MCFVTTETRHKSKRQKPQEKHVFPHLSVYKNVKLYSCAKKRKSSRRHVPVRCLYDVSIEIISSSEINYIQVLCAPALNQVVRGMAVVLIVKNFYSFLAGLSE